MNQYQFVPFARASEFFETIYNHKISPATIVNAVSTLAGRLELVDSGIKELLTKTSLVNCDETSSNISGNKQWLHTVGNEQLTHYAIHENRGSKATKDIGILPDFTGTMIHDHWKSYYVYSECQHGLCNAHHLRELRFLHEHHGIKWANKISKLLIEINDKKIRLMKADKYFSKKAMGIYSDRYDDILRKAGREQAKRGTIDSKNLLKRLKSYKDSVLLFMTDKTVPFTNNLSERDLRMNKIKQKVSGCFRSIIGGNNFCIIRETISTAKKNKKNVFQILQKAFYEIISVNDLLLE